MVDISSHTEPIASLLLSKSQTLLLTGADFFPHRDRRSSPPSPSLQIVSLPPFSPHRNCYSLSSSPSRKKPFPLLTPPFLTDHKSPLLLIDRRLSPPHSSRQKPQLVSSPTTPPPRRASSQPQNTTPSLLSAAERYAEPPRNRQTPPRASSQPSETPHFLLLTETPRLLYPLAASANLHTFSTLPLPLSHSKTHHFPSLHRSQKIPPASPFLTARTLKKKKRGKSL